MRRALLCFLISLALFSLLQSFPTFPDPDSFYHAKMALLLRDQGIPQEFPWLQATILRNVYVNHHFLYHVLLIPFVTLFDPLLGIKMATAIFAALAMTMVYILLRTLQVRYPGAWVLLLSVTAPFIYRVSLAKAPGISVFFLLLGFWLMIKTTQVRTTFQCFMLHASCFMLSFAYVWLYSAWPFLVVTCVVYWAVSRYALRVTRYGLLITCFAGISSGLILNPYFPENIKFAWWQIGEIGLGVAAAGVGGVMEWLPYTPGELFTLAFPLIVAWAVSVGLFIVHVMRAQAEMTMKEKEQTVVWFTTLAMGVLLALGTLKARRNIEYLAPFMVVNTALGFALWGRALKFKLRKLSFGIITALWALATAAVVTTVRNFTVTFHQFQSGFATASFAPAATWLRDTTPEGSLVLLPSWDRFPMFFYYNTHNYYLDGLHPRFTELKAPGDAERFGNLRRGELTNTLRTLQEFNVSYVVTDALRTRLHNMLQDDRGVERVYQDDTHTVYQVIY